MTDQELEALAAKVNALLPPSRLRLAAGLLEARKATLALPIIRGVADELAAAIFLQTFKAKPYPTEETR